MMQLRKRDVFALVFLIASAGFLSASISIAAFRDRPAPVPATAPENMLTAPALTETVRRWDEALKANAKPAPALTETVRRLDEALEASAKRGIGIVKWYEATNGFGFIQPDDGGPDIFVRVPAVERSGLGTLCAGSKISYEIVAITNPRITFAKSSAENLQILAEAPGHENCQADYAALMRSLENE